MKIPFSYRIKKIRKNIKRLTEYRDQVEEELTLKEKNIRVQVTEEELHVARNTPRSASGYVHKMTLNDKEAFDLYKILQQLFE